MNIPQQIKDAVMMTIGTVVSVAIFVGICAVGAYLAIHENFLLLGLYIIVLLFICNLIEGYIEETNK